METLLPGFKWEIATYGADDENLNHEIHYTYTSMIAGGRAEKQAGLQEQDDWEEDAGGAAGKDLI